ncbi:N-glycosylase/DNA lyase [Astathelohania contejeani]|uniref:DNA-(apurinic or apyrimidinic site) lyase n=1 Tax=Astathelohania contejeani TaxID=164912 RepID=A0ABQ7HW01_9MICR|nr:N-glycosylase/DNA lyase [Thelohania contejeani]
MEWKKYETSEIIDLRESLFSGQIFSFKETRNLEYTGVIEGHLFTLKTNGCKELYYINHTMHPSPEDAIKKFFTLELNYEELLGKWGMKPTGLRLLRIDPIESIFSFICSANNNIKRITKMVNFLYSKGQFIKSVNDINFYKFPNLEILANIEEELKINKFGYRARYISRTAQLLLETDIQKLANISNLSKKLREYKGIGKKVADCIALMGFGRYSNVPVDIHIYRYSKEKYNLDVKNLNETNYKKIQKAFFDEFGEYCGIAQLFIFKNLIDKNNS